ncbi:hypothetical protein PQQ64_07955 [Paraburkholderia graminis]|uniref:hypothetical protein n=1 Tax=Paraburkholderia graminis TaxID=60548 RepID=UPI0038B80AF4
MNRPAAAEGELPDLVRKEISPIDAPYILDLLNRTTEDWEKRGPIFSMLAQKIVDGKITTRDFWPIDPVLEDAARYRTLQQMARFVYLDVWRPFSSHAFRRPVVTRIGPLRPEFPPQLTISRIATAGDLTSRERRHTALNFRHIGERTTTCQRKTCPVEYIRAAYRHREKLVPQLLTVLALGVISRITH